MKYAKNCLRIPPDNVRDERKFEDLINMLSDYREAIPQLTFFLMRSNLPMRLQYADEECAMLEDRMRRARQRGFECGINILVTVGAFNDGRIEYAITEDFTRITCIDGERCMGSYCWNDEGMRGYITSLYQRAAKAKPSYIWMDDEVRFSHPGYGCYCDNCLRIFAGECGTLYTREELRKAFESEEERRKPELGIKWLRHNRNSLAGLVRLVEKAVSDIDPGIGIGFMSCECDHDGYGFAGLAEAMRGGGGVVGSVGGNGIGGGGSGNCVGGIAGGCNSDSSVAGGREVLWRPGGGVYTDEALCDLIWKAHRIGRQIAPLPAFVETIQSEVESYPYQLLRKGPSSTAFEAAAYIASGCTGAAFNVISEGISGEGADVFRPLFKKIARTQPFYNLLVQNFGRLPPNGVCAAWSEDLKAAIGMTVNSWAGDETIYFIAYKHQRELSELGLPISYALENAQAVTLCGVSAKAMPHDMITRILSGGVYMDAEALDTLNAMGYGNLTGFSLKEYVNGDNSEQYTDHPINAGIAAGAGRCIVPNFYRGDAAILEATDPKAESLSRLYNYKGDMLSEYATGLFVNELGGRVCVGGYYPWGLLENATKSRQIKNLFLYLSGGTLPSYIHSYNRIHHWTRAAEGGGAAIAVVNASLDELDDAVIMVKTDKATCRSYDMECREYDCQPAAGAETPAGYDGYRAFALPLLKPWQMALLIC